MTDGRILDIEVADEAGLRTILGWAAEEGWAPGLADAGPFFAADPGGFLLGRLDGEPIAAVSLVRYDPSWAFLGLYIVRPAHRGRGHGIAMWQAAMARVEGRSVGLDGVVAQQANYARSGFVRVRANSRFTGMVPTPDGSDPATGVVDATGVPFAAVETLDGSFFPAPRPAFLRAWLGTPRHAARVALDADGRPVGYGVIRPCVGGWRMGPLLAPDAATAERLIDALLAAATPGEAWSIDVPVPNTEAVRVVERRGMAASFETARMVLGTVPDEPIDRIFGVTTLELG